MANTIFLILILIQLGITYNLKFIIGFILARKIDFSKLSKRDLFSPDVMEVYLLAIEHPAKFSFDEYVVNISGKDFAIWRRSELYHRRFYWGSDSNKELVEGMNSKLTHYDRYLLDKLCVAVQEGQTKTLELFFDK